MSYSFTVRADTKADIDRLVAEQFDQIIANDPMHAIDRNQARTAVHGFMQMLKKPDGDQDIRVTVSGYLSWQADGEGTAITGSNLAVSCSLLNKVDP